MRNTGSRAARAVAGFFLLIGTANAGLGQAPDWQVTKSDHFLIYSSQKDPFTERISGAAEKHYKRIRSELGFAKNLDFWTWDKRVKVFLYPDKDSYVQATGAPIWSEGLSDYQKRIIFSYAGSQKFLDSVLPHEIGHLLFREFVQFHEEIPTWLDEGVAQWMESEEMQREVATKARELYEKDQLVSVKDITLLNIHIIDIHDKKLFFRTVRTKDKGQTLAVFSPDVLINNYYIEAGSLVGFLLESYGTASFAQFCRELRDKKSFEDALSYAYGEHARTFRELDDAWRKYLAREEI